MHARYPELRARPGRGRRAPPRQPRADGARRGARAARTSARTSAPGSRSARSSTSRADEWAATAEDVLWRRTKCGLHMDAAREMRGRRRRRWREAAGRSLSRVSAVDRRAIRGVLTDIDDTLTTDGRLLPEAYAALERLRAAGLLVIPVTGRPAGWCDHIARMWPVDAVVGENGAFWFRHDAKARQAREALRGERRGAAQRARAAGCDRRAHPRARCPAARSPPTSPIARPTSRSTSARTCRRCRARRWRASSRSWKPRASPRR